MCCGSGAFTPPPAMTGVAGAPPANTKIVWKVTYPNMAVMWFHDEGLARQAASISGGSMERIDPPSSQPDETEAER